MSGRRPLRLEATPCAARSARRLRSCRRRRGLSSVGGVRSSASRPSVARAHALLWARTPIERARGRGRGRRTSFEKPAAARSRRFRRIAPPASPLTSRQWIRESPTCVQRERKTEVKGAKGISLRVCAAERKRHAGTPTKETKARDEREREAHLMSRRGREGGKSLSVLVTTMEWCLV